MRTVINILSQIPPAFLDRPHVATRYLYQSRRPGRLTVLFQRHPLTVRRPMHLQAYPDHLDTDTAFKLREDPRIYALTYVLAGKASLTYSGGETHVLEPGSVFQYNGQTLSELSLEPSPGFTECSVSADGATGRGLASLEIWDTSVSCARAGLHVDIVRAYLDIYRTVLDPSRSARGLLSDFGNLLDRCYSFLGRENPEDRFKTRACSLLTANLSPRYTMPEAARALAMPYDTFRRRFRRLMGIAPIEYQVRRRMEQACALLPHHSVKQTAYLLDYNDPFIFSRQFRSYTGMSPSEYRKRTASGAILPNLQTSTGTKLSS